jgi:lactose/raffinose/galactose permease
MSTINVIMGVIASAVFAPISKKYSRKAMFVTALCLMLVGLGIFAIAGKSVPLAILACVVFGMPQQLVFLVVLMTITDSVEYGQLKLGHRDESLTLSVRPLIDKFGGAISNGVVGQVAVIAGMTTGATAASITAADQVKFKIAMLLLPAIFLILSMIIFSKKVILTDQKHTEIVAELEATWGQQFENEDSETEAAEVKGNGTVLTAPVSGELLQLKDSSDPNFASGKMGKGFAIKPNDGRVYAPFDGEVAAAFATRHAIGLKSKDGLTVLIHIGIDTAKLNGTGFVQYVVQGQEVKKGHELIEFWDPTIKQHGLDDTVLVTVVNSKDYQKLAVTEKFGKTVAAGDPIMEIE